MKRPVSANAEKGKWETRWLTGRGKRLFHRLATGLSKEENHLVAQALETACFTLALCRVFV